MVTSMRIDILTLFPEMFAGPFDHSIAKRAIEKKLVNIIIHNIRDFAQDKHRTVDDYPYGGGAGMVLKPEPIFRAVDTIRTGELAPCVILLTPQGRLFNQKIAGELTGYSHLVLICGHYEGIDERVRENLVDDEISIGDYILSGGEIAAMVMVDAIIRLLPGAIGSEASVNEDSFSGGLLKYPQYTRPAVYRGLSVPEVLLSGNHEAIAQWRREQSLLRTLKRHPELLNKVSLSEAEKAFIQSVQKGYTSGNDGEPRGWKGYDGNGC